MPPRRSGEQILRFSGGTFLALAFASCVVAQTKAKHPYESLEARQLVWKYLQAERSASASPFLRELRRRRSFTVEALDAALSAGPEHASWPRGRVHWPFTIPGTKIKTLCELHIPQKAPKKGYGLWISSHGTGGSGENVLNSWLRPLKGKGFIIAGPTEAADLHGKGWGARPRERQLHIALIDQLARRFPIDRDRVILSGWSRGGHATWDVALRFADRLAGIAPIIGGPALRDSGLLGNLCGLRIHSVNGGLDQAGLIANVRRAGAMLERLGCDAEIEIDPKRGHAYFGDRLQTLADQMSAVRRNAAPKRLRFATLNSKRYGRHHYIRILRTGREAWKPGKTIRLAGLSRMDESQRRKAYLSYVESHTARMELSFSQNRFEIHSWGIASFELYYPAAWVDPSEPVVVVVNGKSRRRKIGKTRAADRLKLMRRFGTSDPAHRFLAVQSFRPK